MPLKSNCCNKDLTVSTSDEGTCCYICSECNKPCDAIAQIDSNGKIPDHLISSLPETVIDVLTPENIKMYRNRKYKELNKLVYENDKNKEIERVAMNIVYQLDDDSGLSLDFRQANNDKRINFVIKLISELIEDTRRNERYLLNEFVADERDKVAKDVITLSRLNDKYEEGYWIAMNTIMKHLESLDF